MAYQNYSELDETRNDRERERLVGQILAGDDTLASRAKVQELLSDRAARMMPKFRVEERSRYFPDLSVNAIRRVEIVHSEEETPRKHGWGIRGLWGFFRSEQ